MREQLTGRDLEAVHMKETISRQRMLIEKQDQELTEADEAVKDLNDTVSRLTVELQQFKIAAKEYEACQESISQARQQALELAQARAKLVSLEADNAALRSEAEDTGKQLKNVKESLSKFELEVDNSEHLRAENVRTQQVAAARECEALRDEVTRLTESLRRASEAPADFRENECGEELESLKAVNVVLRRDCHRLQKLVRSKEKALQAQAAELDDRQEHLTRSLRLQFEETFREHRGAAEAKVADLKAQLRERENNERRMKELMQAELASLRIWAQELGRTDQARRCEALVADEFRRASKWAVPTSSSPRHHRTLALSGSNSFREGRAGLRRAQDGRWRTRNAPAVMPPRGTRRSFGSDSWGGGVRSCSLPPQQQRPSCLDFGPVQRQEAEYQLGHRKGNGLHSDRKASFAVAEEERIHAAFRDQRGWARKGTDEWNSKATAQASGTTGATPKAAEAAGPPQADVDTWPMIEALLRLHNQQ
eukprot:Polyplicarium_translucidae@DN3389_c0_g3_i3.p1